MWKKYNAIILFTLIFFVIFFLSLRSALSLSDTEFCGKLGINTSLTQGYLDCQNVTEYIKQTAVTIIYQNTTATINYTQILTYISNITQNQSVTNNFFYTANLTQNISRNIEELELEYKHAERMKELELEYQRVMPAVETYSKAEIDKKLSDRDILIDTKINSMDNQNNTPVLEVTSDYIWDKIGLKTRDQAESIASGIFNDKVEELKILQSHKINYTNVIIAGLLVAVGVSLFYYYKIKPDSEKRSNMSKEYKEEAEVSEAELMRKVQEQKAHNAKKQPTDTKANKGRKTDH